MRDLLSWLLLALVWGACTYCIWRCDEDRDGNR